MSGLDERRFRRLLIWYPASWRRAHGEILVAMMLDDAERAGRAAPSAAEIRAAVVHGLAARLGGPATVVIAALAVLLAVAGQVTLLAGLMSGATSAPYEAALFASAGAAPAATGVALVALLRTLGVLRDGAALLAAAGSLLAGVAGGLAALGWGQGFEAADAGEPQTGLAAATAPLGAVGIALTAAVIGIVLVPVLRRTGLSGVAATILAVVLAVITAPITGYLAVFSPPTTPVVAIAVLVVAVLPRVRGARSSGNAPVASRPAPVRFDGPRPTGSGPACVLGGVALGSGVLGVLWAFAGAGWSPTAGGDATVAMREGITILSASMIPGLVAVGVAALRSRRRPARDVWIPILAVSAGFAVNAVEYLTTDGSGAFSLGWLGAAAAIGFGIAWWIAARMPVATGIRVGIGAGMWAVYSAVLGLALTPMLAFGAPLLGLAMLVFPWRRQTAAGSRLPAASRSAA